MRPARYPREQVLGGHYSPRFRSHSQGVWFKLTSSAFAVWQSACEPSLRPVYQPQPLHGAFNALMSHSARSMSYDVIRSGVLLLAFLNAADCDAPSSTHSIT